MTANNRSDRDKKKPFPQERLVNFTAVFTYLQVAQVQFEPQLQSTHVQFGLLHFTF